MAEFVSPGPCSFSLRRKELATVTILSQILSVIFASLNSLIGKKDRLAPRSERETTIGKLGFGLKNGIWRMEFRFSLQRFVQRVCWLELTASVMKRGGWECLPGGVGRRLKRLAKQMWARSQWGWSSAANGCTFHTMWWDTRRICVVENEPLFSFEIQTVMCAVIAIHS